MKATILHETKGRMRVQIAQKNMSLEQADQLENYLNTQPQILRAVVHERTCCAVIYYQTNHRHDVIFAIQHFSYANVPQIAQSSRALSRSYQEKLVGKILTKAACTVFLPAPLRIARIVWHMIPFLRKGFRCIVKRQIKVELLDALSIGISACRRDFSTAGMVMFLLEIGELLEEWTRKKSIQDLAQCMSLHVDRVWLYTEHGEVLTPIQQIQPQDIIRIRMGSVIPLDGVVLEGEAMVNQASLTGESIPIAKHSGSMLYAGTVMEEGECLMKVTQKPGESRYDKIVSLIEHSEQFKSTLENKAANLADRLVPYTFVGSLLSLLCTRNLTRALSVLMVDFSCALKLAMPLAVLSAMREASKVHITVKGGKFLEMMAQADTIVFDKTGTLTHACPTVSQVVAFDGKEEKEMLRLAACLEEHFPHSMANAVVQAAKERGLTHEEFHSKVEYIVAHGIVSTVNGEKVCIGSAHFIFEDEGCQIPEQETKKFHALPDTCSHLYLAIQQRLAAVICISDPLRAEAAQVLDALRHTGIQQTVMLTGDSKRTAAHIAKQIGVDAYEAEVLPADKAAFIAKQKKEGHIVIMVGDGINDSPALSEANVGIAVRDGAAIAQEVADITIASNSLWELVILRELSQALLKRIERNYKFVIGFNAGLILFGLFGFFTPAASATLHNLSTLGVSLHSMQSLPKKKQKPAS